MKYALMFTALGGAISLVAMTTGGWCHVLHWFSLDCIFLAIGYAGAGPRIFGKGADGRIPWWSRLVHFPYMTCSACIWRIVRSVTRENASDEVSTDLVLARRLLESERPPDVANYLDLTAEFEDPRQIRKAAGYLCFPILDGDIPGFGALRSMVGQLGPGRTLIHCAQGHGRTGLVALALLAEAGEIQSYEEGMELLRTARPGAPQWPPGGLCARLCPQSNRSEPAGHGRRR